MANKEIIKIEPTLYPKIKYGDKKRGKLKVAACARVSTEKDNQTHTFIEQFKIEHGGIIPTEDVVKDAVKKEFPMVELLSLDAAETQGYAEDKNDLMYLAYLEEQSKKATDPRIDKLLDLMTELTDNQRALVQKVFYEGKSQTDVAAELNVTKQAIQNRLNKIYARLRKLLEQ